MQSQVPMSRPLKMEGESTMPNMHQDSCKRAQKGAARFDCPESPQGIQLVIHSLSCNFIHVWDWVLGWRCNNFIVPVICHTLSHTIGLAMSLYHVWRVNQMHTGVVP